MKSNLKDVHYINEFVIHIDNVGKSYTAANCSASISLAADPSCDFLPRPSEIRQIEHASRRISIQFSDRRCETYA